MAGTRQNVGEKNHYSHSQLLCILSRESQNELGVPNSELFIHILYNPKGACVGSSVPSVAVLRAGRNFKRWGLVGGCKIDLSPLLWPPVRQCDLSLLHELLPL
jgi:hypothetical protein